LVEACLKIAPKSTVLACDVSYRKDVLDVVVDLSNEMFKGVVGDVNREVGGEGWRWRWRWEGEGEAG
jgi:hypothetical protein